MFVPPGMGYDRAITIFSPDGRIYQVEYAQECVRKGWTALGVKVSEGVVLVGERRFVSRLMRSTEKILKIDEHIGLAFAGLQSDARVLIDRARIYAQIHRMVYDEPIPVEALARRICDIKQAYTQHGGVRPFGVSFLFAGVDETGAQLIETDPGGNYFIIFAHAIGRGANAVMDVLEKEYNSEMSLNDAIVLTLKALRQSVEEGVKLSPETVEIGVVDIKTKIFRKLSLDEIKAYITKIQ